MRTEQRPAPPVDFAATLRSDGSGPAPAPEPEPEELRRGASLDRYIVLERLGAGGMGVVYAAYDPELDRKVAIKLLRGDARDGASSARLLREAKAMARVTHPNVIAVHDVGVIDQRVFVAMEFVDGPTLRGWQEQAPRPWREVVDMYLQAGRGLAAAHRAGLVHRDFKPDNVLVGADGRARVLDFGLARAVAGDTPLPAAGPTPPVFGPDDLHSNLTMEGSIVGTPAYMAPEQRLALAVDARCDQYGFCVALWEALTGVFPFAGDNTLALLAAAREQRTEPIPRDRDVPAWLVRALLRGLRAQPAERHASMDELLAALDRDPARARRRRLLALAAAAASAAGVWGMSRETDAPARCGGAASQSAGVWDEPQQVATRAAFRATGQPYAEDAYLRVARRLDARLRAWQMMHTEACAATQIRGEQSPDLMDRRMACLHERLAETQALVRTFAVADAAVVERAAQATEELRPLAACTDLRALTEAGGEPALPARRAEVTALRLRLAEAWGANAAGRHEVARELAGPIAAAADAAGACGVAAEARRLAGLAACRTGQPERGVVELADAVWSATGCRRDETVADAALSLVYCVGVRQARYAEAEVWSRHAEAAIVRLGGDQDRRRASLLGYRGLVAFDRGGHAEARALQEQALALAERSLPADSPLLATFAGYLGVTLEQLGELDASLQLHRRALALTEQSLGREHPMTAIHYNNIGNLLARLGEREQALAFHERDLAISLRTLGPRHPETALSYINHAAVLGELGRDREGLVELLRAREILADAVPREHPDHALLLNNLGSSWSNLGYDVEARAALEEALAISERVHGGYHLDASYADLGLARLDVRAGRPDQALARAERVRAFRAGSFGDHHEDTAEVDAHLGQLLAGLGRCDEARARFAAAAAVLRAELPAAHPHLHMLQWLEAACQDDDARVAAGASALREPGPPDLRAEVLLRAAEAAWSKGQSDMARETAGAAARLLERTGPSLAPLRARAAALQRAR